MMMIEFYDFTPKSGWMDFLLIDMNTRPSSSAAAMVLRIHLLFQIHKQ